MYNPLLVEIVQGESNFGHSKTDDIFLHMTHPIEVKSQVAPEHKVKDHKEIFIILKGVAEIADKEAVYFFKQPPLLNNVLYSMLLDAALFQGHG